MVEDLVVAGPGQQPSSLPCCTLQGEGAGRGTQDVEVPNSHPAFRPGGTRIDGEQGSVRRIDPTRGVSPVGDAFRQSYDVP